MKLFPQIQRGNGGTSEEEVASFESRRGVQLPSDYRSFLLEHDGGALVENTLRLDAPGTEGYELTLRSLRGIHEEEMLFSDLEGAQDCFSDRISREFLIIGEDFGGNQFLMRVMRPHTIFWWSHDDEEPQEIAINFG